MTFTVNHNLMNLQSYCNYFTKYGRLIIEIHFHYPLLPILFLLKGQSNC